VTVKDKAATFGRIKRADPRTHVSPSPIRTPRAFPRRYSAATALVFSVPAWWLAQCCTMVLHVLHNALQFAKSPVQPKQLQKQPKTKMVVIESQRQKEVVVRV